MSILENKQFKTVLDNLISELSKEYIESFKIGVTRDLNERQNSSYYNGYQLFRLANIESGRVKNIEYETILYFKDSYVGPKCENEYDAAGSGQVDGANELYIAIKARKSDDKQYYFDVISTLKDEEIKL